MLFISTYDCQIRLPSTVRRENILINEIEDLHNEEKRRIRFTAFICTGQDQTSPFT